MTEDPAAPHFELFSEAFHRAAEAAGSTESRFISIADTTVGFSFAGPEMLDVYWPSVEPPLRTVDPGPAGPDVSIEVFDSASTGVAAPELSWRNIDLREDYAASYEGTEVVALQEVGRSSVSLVRPRQGRAVQHAPGRDSVTWIERASAFRFTLTALLAPRGLHLVHAAAVGAGGAGVLLAGPSGSGKSTLSIACLQGGLDWVADDYIVLEPGAVPIAHAMQVTAKLIPDSVEALGAERLVVGEPAPPDNKAVLIVPPELPGFVLRLPLRGILIPRVGGARPTLTPATRGDAFSALALTTMFQPTSRSRATMVAIGALVAQLPAAFIDLGPDHAENADAISEAIRGF